MKSKILEEIEELVEQSEILAKKTDRFSTEHIRWVFKVKAFLKEKFGEESEYFINFVSFSWVQERQAIIGGIDRPEESRNPQLGIDRVNREAYLEQLRAAKGFLLAAKDELERSGVGKESEVESFLEKIRESIDLCTGGFLRFDEFKNLKKESEILFNELFGDERDSIVFRKFYKLKNSSDWIWNQVPKVGSGGFVGLNKLDILFKLEEILKEVLASSGVEVLEEDVLISKGDHYSARKTLRGIFSQAKKTLAIMDNYLDHSILELLEIQVGAGNISRILLLTTDNNKAKFNSLASDLQSFRAQYPSCNIELKKATIALSHDRFIIIDDVDVFQSGHSLGNLGGTTSRISKMTKQEDISRLLLEFNNAWDCSDVV